jgi:hypothetical protein
MTLQIKEPCVCTFDGYVQSYYPCPYCNGTKEVGSDVHLDEWSDEHFEKLEDDVDVEEWEGAIDKITCVCGDELILSGGNTEVCKCGRIYRSYQYIKVDKSHIGEIDYLIEQSKKEREQIYSKYQDSLEEKKSNE